MGLGNLLKFHRAGDRSLQLLVFNEEFLVSVSHQLALITSLPFVHEKEAIYVCVCEWGEEGFKEGGVVHTLPTAFPFSAHTQWVCVSKRTAL